MNFKTPDELEDRKERIADRANREMEELYIWECKKVLTWFESKFPKRHLKWVDGMGTHFWVLDGEILDTDTMRPDHSGSTMFSRHIPMVDKEWTRQQLVLKPLVDFYNSIKDDTYVPEHGVQIGEWEIDRVSREIVQCF